MPVPISLRWPECVNDQLSAFAVKLMSLFTAGATGSVGSTKSAVVSSESTNGLASHPVVDPSDSDQSDTTDVFVERETKAKEGATAVVAMGNGTGAPNTTPLTAESS